MIEGNMRQSLEDFCEKSRINFDETIAQCINDICNGNSNEMNISEVASLVRLSSDPQFYEKDAATWLLKLSSSTRQSKWITHVE